MLTIFLFQTFQPLPLFLHTVTVRLLILLLPVINIIRYFPFIFQDLNLSRNGLGGFIGHERGVGIRANLDLGLIRLT